MLGIKIENLNIIIDIMSSTDKTDTCIILKKAWTECNLKYHKLNVFVAEPCKLLHDDYVKKCVDTPENKKILRCSIMATY